MYIEQHLTNKIMLYASARLYWYKPVLHSQKVFRRCRRVMLVERVERLVRSCGVGGPGGPVYDGRPGYPPLYNVKIINPRRNRHDIFFKWSLMEEK